MSEHTAENGLADAIYRAIDWDFVELFHEPDEGEGYYSPRHFCEVLATSVTSPGVGA